MNFVTSGDDMIKSIVFSIGSGISIHCGPSTHPSCERTFSSTMFYTAPFDYDRSDVASVSHLFDQSVIFNDLGQAAA